MSTAKIIALVVGVVVIAGGSCVGAVVLGIYAYRDDVRALGKRMEQDGRDFGAQHTQLDCLEEAGHRISACDGLGCELKANLFFGFCLGPAHPSPGFCDGVPPQSAMLDSVAWRLRRCQSMAELDPERCGRLVGGWQTFCDDRARGHDSAPDHDPDP